MIHMIKNTIEIVKFTSADKPYVSLRGNTNDLWICSPPKVAGVYPHAVLYDSDDIYKKVEWTFDIARVGLEVLDDASYSIPEGSDFFLIIFESVVRVGYRVRRKVNERVIPTSRVVIFEYGTDTFRSFIKQVHVDVLVGCKFRRIDRLLEGEYNVKNDSPIKLRHWREGLDQSYNGPILASDMLKDIFLLLDYMESVSYIKDVDSDFIDLFGYDRVVGEESDVNLADIYHISRKDATLHLLYNEESISDINGFFQHIGYERHKVMSQNGLNYLRNLWLNSDRYINDLGL